VRVHKGRGGSASAAQQTISVVSKTIEARLIAISPVNSEAVHKGEGNRLKTKTFPVYLRRISFCVREKAGFANSYSDPRTTRKRAALC
jgi:hypothetical protein